MPAGFPAGYHPPSGHATRCALADEEALDILANLVHAGLRDHRIGFVLLSVSGLGILDIMIGITLRRDRDWAWGVARRFRARLGAWD